MASGTTWYKITKEDILKNSPWTKNVWFRTRIADYPLDEALDIDSLDGSFVVDDILYYMSSDYAPILIYGEEVEPIDIDELDLTLDDLSEYVNEMPPVSIFQRITDSDISWLDVDIDSYAIKLLNEDYSFQEVAEGAAELGLIDIL